MKAPERPEVFIQRRGREVPQDLADRLVKKDRSNTELSAAANDLCDQVALARAVSRLCHMTLKYSILIVKVNTKT